ncbi:MAG TPA: hypothetical protein VHZ24_08265 [Pirellulales bacterium]|nr:hypothetical protein [Pirellulales bacterium]
MRLTDVEPGLRFEGTIRGPFCEYARTLPSSIRFVDVSDERATLAKAIVIDPCFWTPEMPFLYRAEVELKRDTAAVGEFEFCFGIRRLIAVKRRLSFEGRWWVLRAVDRAFDEDAPWQTWRDQSAACVVRSPSETILEEASRLGVLLVAVEHDLERLPYLARWPAVGIILVRRGTRPAPMNLLVAQNVLVGEYFNSRQVVFPAAWSQIVAADPSVELVLTRPRVACRWVHDAGLAEARAQCDHLQRDLAGRGEYAGYMILRDRDSTA